MGKQLTEKIVPDGPIKKKVVKVNKENNQEDSEKKEAV
jgi:hypothetical protein